MAFTKAELEALKNSILASNKPITAAQHRAFVQNLIDEMYDAQSRGDLLAGVQEDVGTAAGDLVLVLREGDAFLVPASVFGGGSGNLVDLGDVVITSPEADDLLSYDAVMGKWVNVPLAGLYVTQAELEAALDNLQLPEGARLISAELTLSSDTAGTITAQWVDFESQTESVTAQALAFNGGGLPAAGNFRFDIVQGANDGTVSVKQGTEADAASVVIPAPDANNVVLAVILWAEDGTSEVAPPTNGNPQQNEWDLIRRATAVAPNTTGKFAKIWEGNLGRDANYSLVLAYAEPKNAVSFDGSGVQLLKASWTCDGSRAIIADTVQLTTGDGSTAGEFVLYRLSGNKAALYHKSNHFWGRIQYRVAFHNSQIRLADFTTNSAYGAAPTALNTYASTVDAGGALSFLDLTDTPANYTGAAGKLVKVNGTEDGLEFETEATGLPPVAETYANLAALIADQANQIAGYIYADEKFYYEYLGTTLGTSADYRRLFIQEYTAATHRENNTVLFDGDYVTGINGSARSGNILFSFTGAQLGACTVMKHQDASAFTFPAEADLMFATADISTTVANYFMFVCVKTDSPQIVHVFHAIEGGV